MITRRMSKRIPKKKSGGAIQKKKTSMFITEKTSNDNEPTSLSRKDKKVFATMNIFKCVLDETVNVGNLLGEMSTELSDWSAGKKPSQRIINKHCRNMNLCKEVLQGTTEEITKSAQETSPISGMLQIFHRQRVYEKTNLTKCFTSQPTKSKSLAQIEVEKAKVRYVNPIPRNNARLMKPRTSKNKSIRASSCEINIDYPLPQNGLMYTPPELWTILHEANDRYGFKSKRAIMQEVLSKNQVGVKNQTELYKLYKKESTSDCAPCWNMKGRKRYLSMPDIKAFVQNKSQSGSITFGKSDVAALVNKGKEKWAKANGLALTTDNCTANPVTHDRYVREVALLGVMQGDLSICKSDNVTTEVRMIAGNFLTFNDCIYYVCMHFALSRR